MRIFVALGVAVAIIMVAYGIIASSVVDSSPNGNQSTSRSAADVLSDDPTPVPTMPVDGSDGNPAGLQDSSASVSGLSSGNRCFDGDLTAQSPVAGRTIIVDPGHGGEDLGTVNMSVDLTESELVLGISLLLRDRLLASGADVCMTRVTDVYIGLAERAQFANRHNGDAFVSIHLNSLPDPSENHAMTMWGTEAKDRFLAETLLEALRFRMATPEYYSGEPNPMSPEVYRIKDLSSSMLRTSEMPAVLVEASFLSNPWEANAFLSGIQDGSHWRERQVADAVHYGLLNYFDAFAN